MGHKVKQWPEEGDGGVSRESYIYEWIDSFEPKSIFFDVGSCCGQFAAYASDKGHEVWAFEPGVANSNHIKEALNQCSLDFELITDPVYSHKTVIQWNDGQPRVGGHHKFIVEQGEFQGDAQLKGLYRSAQGQSLEERHTCFLDQFPQADYIKIDVDGAERAVLRGAKQQLNSARELCVEFNVDWPTEIEGFRETYRKQIHGTLYNVFYKNDN
jgi:FkbM family methyltransferase